MAFIAYSIYHKQILAGNAHPNITSWAVWSFMTLLNFTSYKAMSKDWLKSLLPTVNNALCVLTFVLALFQGQFRSLNVYDSIVLTVGITASLLWWILKKKEGPKAAMVANLMVQVGLTVGCIPTFQSVWAKPESEVALCWFLWTISFAFQTIVVILRWKGQKQDLVYPINCLWLHLVVGLLALR